MAYRGQMPDDVLSGQSVERRVRFWRSFIHAGRPGELVFVAVEGGEVCGFAHVGTCWDTSAADGTGEITSLSMYLAPEVQGTGHSRALMQICVDHMVRDRAKRFRGCS